MRHLKGFVLFKEEVDSEFLPPYSNPDLEESNDKVKTAALKEIQDNIKDFNQKKSIMDSIFEKSEESKIDSDLKSKVYGGESNISKRNPYLREYEAICKLGRLVKNIQGSILDDKSQIDETNRTIRELRSSLSELPDPSNSEKIEGQIEKNEQYVKDLKNNISQNKSKLSKVNQNFDKRKKDFSSRMKLDLVKVKNYMVANQRK